MKRIQVMKRLHGQLILNDMLMIMRVGLRGCSDNTDQVRISQRLSSS